MWPCSQSPWCLLYLYCFSVIPRPTGSVKQKGPDVYDNIYGQLATYATMDTHTHAHAHTNPLTEHTGHWGAVDTAGRQGHLFPCRSLTTWKAPSCYRWWPSQLMRQPASYFKTFVICEFSVHCALSTFKWPYNVAVLVEVCLLMTSVKYQTTEHSQYQLRAKTPFSVFYLQWSCIQPTETDINIM